MNKNRVAWVASVAWVAWVASVAWLAVGLGVLALGACATGVGGQRPLAVPEFARPDRPGVPEQLHRDLILCLDQAHEGVLSGFPRFRAPGSARRALSEDTSECMARAGWVRR